MFHRENTVADNTVDVTNESQPQLLVLNDDPELLSLLNTYLEKGQGPAICESNSQMNARESFYSVYPDCAIVSGSFIRNSGIHAVKEFAHLCHENHISILIALDKDNLTLYKGCLDFADDLVVYPYEPEDLAVRVLYHLEKRNRILKHILVDPQTGIRNKTFLQQEVERQINDMKRSHEPFAMVCVQLDDLPAVRRAYGYEAAHRIVKELGNFVQNSIRPSDSLFRYDEGFVLVLPKTVKDDAMKLMDRLLNKFAGLRFQTAFGEIGAAFSARVADFVDPLLTPSQCLDLIRFPKDHAESGEKAAVLDTLADSASITLRKLKIAVIDDDRLIREMLRRQLADLEGQDYDVEIRVFPDGEEFFNDPWHRQNERFLLIIDRIMPKMDGLEVLQKIRTQYDRRRYLCMMLTSRDSEADISLAIQRGANDYMIKPFSLHELRARIKRLIRGSQ